MCIPVDIDLRQAAGRFEHARHVEHLAQKFCGTRAAAR
jgi:hypothetical protein